MAEEERISAIVVDGMSEKERADLGLRFRNEHHAQTFFVRVLAPSHFHWHFHQAYKALQSNLFLPGVSGLLNGIEASIRTLICEVEGRPLDGDLGKVMSNRLLSEASGKGLDVSLLAFPNEHDFAEKLPSNQRQDAVRIVQERNDICHGNFRRYVRSDAEFGEFFTPECVAPLAAQLLDISFVWALELARFRQTYGLGHAAPIEETNPPGNPLVHWLEE
ncbi:MAG: hypothetical protein O9247_01220 [Rhodobacteraceae bacterium]|nr:hypothetical protein [Paracoccaceae bacterium]